MAKDVNINIKLEEELKKEFDSLCKDKGYNKSALLRGFIRNFIDQEKEKGKEK